MAKKPNGRQGGRAASRKASTGSWDAYAASPVEPASPADARQQLAQVDGKQLALESARLRVPRAKDWPDDIVAYINENAEVFTLFGLLDPAAGWQQEIPALRTSRGRVSLSPDDLTKVVQVAAQVGFNLAMNRFRKELSSSSEAAGMILGRKAAGEKGRATSSAKAETLAEQARRLADEGQSQARIAEQLGRDSRTIRRWLNGC